jgi:hypothetical protein
LTSAEARTSSELGVTATGWFWPNVCEPGMTSLTWSASECIRSHGLRSCPEIDVIVPAGTRAIAPQSSTRRPPA